MMGVFKKIGFLALCLTLSVTCFASWEVAWEKTFTGPIAGNVVSFKGNLVIGSGKTISALNDQGMVIWQTKLAGQTRSTVFADDDALYVNSEVGLYRLNENGDIQWHFATNDGNRQIPGTSWGWGDDLIDDVWALYRSSPVADEIYVYFGNLSGAWAVDKNTGKLGWHQESVGPTHTNPVIFENKVIFADWDNQLTALNKDSGKSEWVYKANLPDGRWADWYGWMGLHLSPIIDGKNLFIGSRGTYFYNIDATTGKVNWSWKHPSSWIGSAPVIFEENLYFAMSDGFTVHGMNKGSGNQTMLHNIGFASFATPQVFQNQLLIATMSGQLHAIDLKMTTGGVVYTSEACQKHCKQFVKEGGGLNYAAIQPDNTPAGMKKVVDTMLNKLNSILSITTIEKTVLLGFANGNLVALKL